MNFIALGVVYIYGELQQIKRCLDGNNNEAIGSPVAVLRFDMGETETKALLLSLDDARKLRDDLNRILKEYKEIIG